MNNYNYKNIDEFIKKFGFTALNADTLQSQSNTPHEVIDEGGNTMTIDPTKKQTSSDGKTYIPANSAVDPTKTVMVAEDEINSNTKPVL